MYDNADDIPPSSYANHEVIRGRVVKVIDGDTLRIRHFPPPPSSVGPSSCIRIPPHTAAAAERGNDAAGIGAGGGGCDEYEEGEGNGIHRTRGLVARCTIKVRLYGVDAPELSRKKGGVDMPYSREATEYVADATRGGIVYVKLLGKDRYDRVIGRVTIEEGRGGGGDGGGDNDGGYGGNIHGANGEGGGEGVDLSCGLLTRGYASLYTGGGAKYDGRRIEMEGIVEEAMDEGRGMWGAEEGGGRGDAIAERMRASEGSKY